MFDIKYLFAYGEEKKNDTNRFKTIGLKNIFMPMLFTLALNAQEKVLFSSVIQKRIDAEKSVAKNSFVLLPHKPNYLIPLNYSQTDNKIYQKTFEGKKVKNIEAKFQVSIKYVAVSEVFTDNLSLFLAFTSTSWWQSYNNAISNPFRETNYEPEMILSYNKSWSFLGLPINQSSLSLNHQSNGKSNSLSRSWNRIIATATIEQENLVWNLQAWYRLPENRADDDNYDIHKYLGYGQLSLIYKLSDNNNLDIAFRNNLRKNNKGSIEVGWSFPLAKTLKGYVQYFNGYGDGLIHYNHSSQSLGIGFKLTDWL